MADAIERAVIRLSGPSSTAPAPLHYRTDPVAWFADRLGIPEAHIRWSLFPEYAGHQWDGDPDPMVKALMGLANGQDVGVESATTTGKTFLLGAGVTLWFLDCWPGALVVTAAPTEKQLKLHLWKELGAMWPRFRAHRPAAEFLSLNLRMVRPGHELTGWEAIAFPVGVGAHEESATRAQGFHRPHMLIITEETPGMDPAIMTAFENTCMATHNLRLALGNPDSQLDPLHKFCQAPDTVYVRISAYDHPNVVTGNPDLIPGAVSAKKLEERRRKYGDDNPLFLSRARGICPTDAVDALIKLSWCMEAVRRGDDQSQVAALRLKGPRALGADVAASETGDRGSIAEGEGAVLERVTSYRCPDPNAFARDRICTLIGPDLAAVRVAIDAVGVGAGAVNECKRLGHTVLGLMSGITNPPPVRDPITGQEEEERFGNLRSQMWWHIREDIRHGRLILPHDEELLADLTTPRWETKGGRIWVESKETLKVRLGRSPDKGDAAVYWNWVRQYGVAPVDLW
jgi:phage terminase large subunit